MKNLLTYPEVERTMRVSRSGMSPMVTRFDNRERDLHYWRVWLQQAGVQSSTQTFEISFCAAEPGVSHECEGLLRSEYDVSGFQLPNEPGQRLCLIRLELMGADFTVDSQDRPEVLTMRAIVSVRMENPFVEVSTSYKVKLNLRTGLISLIEFV